jgi:hypothetical protein
VVVGAGGAAHEVAKRVGALDLLTGERLSAAPLVERLGRRQLADQLRAADHRLDVGVHAEVGGVDEGLVRRVGGAELQGPAARRPDKADRDRPRALRHGERRQVERHVDAHEVQVGDVQRRVAAEEHRRFREVVLRWRHRPPWLPQHAHQQVVVQVAADTWEVDDDVDAQRRELIGWAQARPQQQRRGVDGAGADDDLGVRAQLVRLTAAGVGDAGTAPPGQQQPLHVGVGDDLEVRPGTRRMQVGGGGTCRLPSLMSRSW